jgi:hypothetical protein
VSDEDVDPAVEDRLQPCLEGPLAHLSFRIHAGALLVAKRSAQTQNTKPFIADNPVLDAFTSLGRILQVDPIVIAMYMHERAMGKSHQKFQIAGTEVSAGNDQFDILEPFRLKKIP